MRTCVGCCAAVRPDDDVLLQSEAIGLASLTVVLAGPVSAALARARWTSRSPRAALFLWQAVGLAGGLGILTAGLTLAAAAVSPDWLTGITSVPDHLGRLGWSGWLGVGLTGCVGAWLVIASTASALRVLRARQAHRRRLDTVSEPVLVAADGRSPDGLRVRLVDHPDAVAYCLPGLRPRVVVSRGALGSLSEGQLAAVLAHERAHARGRHDLVVQPFVAWARTFPFLPTAARATAAVSLLVEMLADDSALRRCGAADLRTALRRLAGERVTGAGPATVDLGGQLAARADRLTGRSRALPRVVSGLVYGLAAVLVLAPPIMLLCS